MRLKFLPLATGGATPRMVWLLLVTAVILAGGCKTPATAFWAPASSTAPDDSPTSEAEALKDDNPLKFADTGHSDGALASSRHLEGSLTVLHVEIPRRQRTLVKPMWNHLREDVLDSDTVSRLHDNGIRVGVASRQWWDAVKAVLDSVPGVRSAAYTPVRLPPNYPLSLQLDQEAHDQTLFFMGADGVLTGETWPQSRNVLRLSYQLNLERPDRLRLLVVPEVRQLLEGWHWASTAGGMTQDLNYNGRAFSAASFAVDLDPEEFLLIAPGENANLYGLVGGVFLLNERDDELCDSYVFLRLDVTDGDQR